MEKDDNQFAERPESDVVMIPFYSTPAALGQSRLGIEPPVVLFEETTRSALLDYAVERKSIIEAKSDILRHFTKAQTERQAQILADYIEELLTEVKYDGLPIDLAVTGLVEAHVGSFA